VTQQQRGKRFRKEREHTRGTTNSNLFRKTVLVSHLRYTKGILLVSENGFFLERKEIPFDETCFLS
jgi:hypothetical protein